MKGADVYLECDIKANPAVKRVEWFQNVSTGAYQSKYLCTLVKCFDDIFVWNICVVCFDMRIVGRRSTYVIEAPYSVSSCCANVPTKSNM